MCIRKTAFREVRSYEHHCTVVLVTCGPLKPGTKHKTATIVFPFCWTCLCKGLWSYLAKARACISQGVSMLSLQCKTFVLHTNIMKAKLILRPACRRINLLSNRMGVKQKTRGQIPYFVRPASEIMYVAKLTWFEIWFFALRTNNEFLKCKGVSRTRFFRDPGYTSDLFQCWRMRRKGKNVCGGPVKVSPLKKQVSF